MIVIEQNTDAGKKIINVRRKHIGSAIRAVGVVVNDIAIEAPLVASPDVDNDAHWTPLMIYDKVSDAGIAAILSADETMLVIAGTLGPIRINKPAGDDVGIAHDW